MSRLEQIQQMLTEDPNDPFLHYAFALELENAAKLSEAIDKLQTMSIDFPDYLPLYYKLGKCYEVNGQTENAILIYNKGIDLAKRLNDQKTLQELKEAVFLIDEE